jgi:hypothetical protein
MLPALSGIIVETRKEKEKSTRVKPISSGLRNMGCNTSKLSMPKKIPT